MLPCLSFLVLSTKQDLDRTLESSSHVEVRAHIEQAADLEEAVNRARDKYITDRNHRLGDRRPELYASLVRDSSR